MQAIILAAGMGKRLGPLTKDQTKGMLKVHGQTLLERSLGQLVDVGVTRIILVVGFEAQGVIDLVGDSFNGTPVIYVHNSEFASTNNIYSLYLARDYLAEMDTLLVESDLIYDTSILDRLLESPDKNIAVVDHYKAWMDGTVVTLRDDNSIESFIPKTDFDGKKAHRYYKTVNIYKFSTDYLAQTYVPFLNAYVQAMGHNEYYEQVLRVIAMLEKHDLIAMPLEGERWYEIDDLQDLQNAETIFEPRESSYENYLERKGGYWRFPKLVDFSTPTNPYFPNQQLVDEMQRSFTPLLRQTPSGPSVYNLLAAKMFQLNPDEVVVGSGVSEIIHALHRVLDTRDNRAKALDLENAAEAENPAYQPYAQINAMSSNEVYDLFHSHIGTRPFTLLKNPGDLHEGCLSTNQLKSLAEAAEIAGTKLVVDETFVDFADPNICESLLDPETLSQFPSLVVVKSIGECYGIPGVSLGVIATTDKALLAEVQHELSTWNISSIAEYFMQIVTKYESVYKTSCAKVRKLRSKLASQLSTIPGIKAYSTEANFILVYPTDATSSIEIGRALLERHGILVKTSLPTDPMDGDFIRLSVRDPLDNTLVVEAFANVLAEAN